MYAFLQAIVLGLKSVVVPSMVKICIRTVFSTGIQTFLLMSAPDLTVHPIIFRIPAPKPAMLPSKLNVIRPENEVIFVQPRGVVSFRSTLRLVVVSVLLPLILSMKSPIRMAEPLESYPA